ncbi:MFS transporter [Dongia sedimenti]|uniref:MFS transporter n=1 Tax=Dongia sedimenti TaxID=3064282 RepID=A0ABU0YJF1_9PROT|nr:MFS transporter [Rhodospirillaceae bacterium R-7]
MVHHLSAIVVLRNRNFLLYALNALLAQLAAEVLIVAIGWSLYVTTRDPFDLALVGLVQFIPNLVLVLVTGAVADRYPRKRILLACIAVELACTFGIMLVADAGFDTVWPLLLLIAGLSVGHAFSGPASLALAPTLVPREHIPAAIATSTSAWQLSAIAGPALGGALLTVSTDFAYATALVMVLVGGLALFGIRVAEQPRVRETGTFDTLVGGFRFMLREKVVLGAASLDLFAVLLGSTPALLPVFAHDILHTEAWGLGLLRSGIGIGALIMVLYLGVRPLRRRAGVIMFATVVVFGLATVVFGFSRSVVLSIAALIVMGASDMISVYIREVLVQLWTPDSLRGRVNAVYMLMISASNELGAFRAGAVAAQVGAVAAVVAGGFCTVAVAALWARWFPALRRADDLSALQELEPDDAGPVTP